MRYTAKERRLGKGMDGYQVKGVTVLSFVFDEKKRATVDVALLIVEFGVRGLGKWDLRRGRRLPAPW